MTLAYAHALMVFRFGAESCTRVTPTVAAYITNHDHHITQMNFGLGVAP